MKKDEQEIQNLFEDKYEKSMGVSYEEWQQNGPQTEEEAYARLQEIDDELQATYDDWYDSTGDEKEKWEEYRDKLKAEYDMLEQVFGLEAPDKNW